MLDELVVANDTVMAAVVTVMLPTNVGADGNDGGGGGGAGVSIVCSVTELSEGNTLSTDAVVSDCVDVVLTLADVVTASTVVVLETATEGVTATVEGGSRRLAVLVALRLLGTDTGVHAPMGNAPIGCGLELSSADNIMFVSLSDATTADCVVLMFVADNDCLTDGADVAALEVTTVEPVDGADKVACTDWARIADAGIDLAMLLFQTLSGGGGAGMTTHVWGRVTVTGPACRVFTCGINWSMSLSDSRISETIRLWASRDASALPRMVMTASAEFLSLSRSTWAPVS